MAALDNVPSMQPILLACLMLPGLCCASTHRVPLNLETHGYTDVNICNVAEPDPDICAPPSTTLPDDPADTDSELVEDAEEPICTVYPCV
jgi:hypothetical protein